MIQKCNFLLYMRPLTLPPCPDLFPEEKQFIWFWFLLSLLVFVLFWGFLLLFCFKLFMPSELLNNKHSPLSLAREFRLLEGSWCVWLNSRSQGYVEGNRKVRYCRISDFFSFVVLSKQWIKFLLVLIVLVLIKMLTLWKSKNPFVHTWINRVGILCIIEE